ncbi:PucR family transcriptional regulator ligand-binding domain-containing protein [Neobacillus mesonae]|nr:PucR family transcriptional regulator ligand-binding domain-containing protein [Neobacillus mesonae]
MIDRVIPPLEDVEFTCADLLKLPHLEGIRLRAGANGLHHPITRVNVMEVPDITDWVKDGEFLMTTGYPFRDSPSMLTEMIPKLVNKGVAALGIKTKRFLDDIPEDTLKLADEYDFPIFELPPHTVFSDVQRETMERVLAHETKILIKLNNYVQQMSQLVLKGKSLHELMAYLEEILQKPSVLIDESNRIYCSGTAAAMAAAAGMEPFSFWQDRYEAYVSASFFNDAEHTIRVTPIHSSGSITHPPVLLTAEHGAPHSELDVLILERVATLIGMELSTIRMREEVEYKYLDQFLQDWLLGRLPLESDIRLRAEASGILFPPSTQVCVILARPLDKDLEKEQLKQAVNKLRAAIRSEERSRKAPEIQAVVISNELLFIVPEADCELALRRVTSEIGKLFKDPRLFSLCIGRPASSLELIDESYKEVLKIAFISRLIGIDKPNVTMESLGIYRLLYLLSDEEDAHLFRDRYIVPLVEYDSKQGASLLLTAKTYLDHNLNAKKTAAALYTHYNTITHRLERIKELLNINFDHADDRLQLEIAIKLYSMQRE